RLAPRQLYRSFSLRQPSLVRTVLPGDDQSIFPLRRKVADESEILAVGRKRNGAVNVRQYLAWRAAEQRDLIELVRLLACRARDVVDVVVIERKRHADEPDFRRRDDLHAAVGRHLLDPQASQITVFRDISDVLAVLRTHGEQRLA